MFKSKILAIFVLLFVYIIITTNIRNKNVTQSINLSKYPLPLLKVDFFQNEVRLLLSHSKPKNFIFIKRTLVLVFRIPRICVKNE